MSSGHLRLVGLRKTFGQTIAVDRVDLEVDRGERVALLGPSGCGKTTTLNMVAGFLVPDEGEIFLGAERITTLPSHKRNTGMVFQQYALFPHLTVFDNVAFGLRMRNVPTAERKARVERVLDRVRLRALKDRYPQQLSGGQQQRVALARAIILEPAILLLDEPLSNLDAKLRQEMRTEMLQLLETVGITTILVTHDQEEALALADRIVIMNAGKVEQIGTPSAIFEDPQTAFVANFMGNPNTLDGVVKECCAELVKCDVGCEALIDTTSSSGLKAGDRVEVLVRAERVQLSLKRPSGSNVLEVEVQNVIYLGNSVRYLLQLGSQAFAAIDQNRGNATLFRKGQKLFAQWSAKDTRAFPVAKSGQLEKVA